MPRWMLIFRNPFISHCQHCHCCCQGSSCLQTISSCGIDTFLWEYSTVRTRMVKFPSHVLKFTWGLSLSRTGIQRGFYMCYSTLVHQSCWSEFSQPSKQSVVFFFCLSYNNCTLRHKHRHVCTFPYSCLSGKLWYLQHNCVGDTIVYH